MTQPKIIPLQPTDLLAVVGLPEGAHLFEMIYDPKYDFFVQRLRFSYKGQNSWYETGEINLPEVDTFYNIIGWSDEITEDVAKGLVADIWIGGFGERYLNYEDYKKICYDTAKESLQSLLRANRVEGISLILRKIE